VTEPEWPPGVAELRKEYRLAFDGGAALVYPGGTVPVPGGAVVNDGDAPAWVEWRTNVGP